jgi:hypothetical protein
MSVLCLKRFQLFVLKTIIYYAFGINGDKQLLNRVIRMNFERVVILIPIKKYLN